MMTTNNGSTKQATLCTCNRPLIPRHCVFCGRRDFYALRSLARVEKVLVDGLEQKIVIKVFRCRVCDSYFDETMNCVAPEKQLTIKAQRVLDEANGVAQTWTEEERAEKLKKLFGSKK